ncbi:MAG: hypothetical protein UH854_03200 [Clostridia bacterium]|nr:hypothetical protein [Clostridia bacterium]
MLGKLIDGNLITPNEMEKKKIIITNPSEESLKFNLGYKDLIIDEKPEYNEETQYLKTSYEETDTTIIKHWEVKEIPPLTE